MTARTPKQQILSEMARELSSKRADIDDIKYGLATLNQINERIALRQAGYDFIRDNMPDDYRPKTY